LLLNKAFTLIELILSVTITAIIAISVVPRFLQTSQFQQQVFTQQAANSLAYAQQLAIGTGCHIAAIASVNTITFNLRQNCTSGSFNYAVFDPKNIGNSLVVTTPYNVTISSINFPIYFDNNGIAYNVNSGTIVNATLNINGFLSQSISVTGATGLISP
jgi:prepilin-type N-terminal cleavage/methylation domain-containing protein